MFCPQCRTEYREGFYKCVDCGASLVSELPPEPATELQPELAPEFPPEPVSECVEFEEILTSLSASDVAMIKSLLDSEGITYHFQGESSYSYALQTTLMVEKDRANEAREILEGLKISGDLPLEDSESGNDE